jgi:predicted Zn-dependent peptidase
METTLDKAEKPTFTGGECRIEKSDLEQIQIIMGFEGALKDLQMDFFKIDIASSILGGGMSSRLFQEIRENRGLAYSVSAWHSAYSQCGIFSIYGGVEPAKANEFIEESIKEIKKMRDSVTEEELNRIKKQLYCSILIGTDGTSSRVNHLISSVAHYGRYITTNEMIQKINSITLLDVKNSIDFIINSKNKTLASIGKLEGNVMQFDEFKSKFN